MPIVPFSYRDPDDLGDSLIPSETHLMMAAAMMRAERFKIEEKPPSGADNRRSN